MLEFTEFTVAEAVQNDLTTQQQDRQFRIRPAIEVPVNLTVLVPNIRLFPAILAQPEQPQSFSRPQCSAHSEIFSKW